MKTAVCKNWQNFKVGKMTNLNLVIWQNDSAKLNLI